MDNTDIISGGTTMKMHSASPRRPLSPTEFKRKVQTLMKQIYELVTLCNVPGCLIIRSPDWTETYTWPESRDEVRKFAEMYFSKSHSGKNSNNGFGSVDLSDQRFKGLCVDEERRFLRELDAKIEGLRKRIESAKLEKNGGECGEADGTFKVFARVLENEGSEDLSEEEDEKRKLVRSFERLNEAFKESIKGKRKFNAEGELDDGKLKKGKKLDIPRMKKLLHEFASVLEGGTVDTNHNDDDGTQLTLGR